MTDLVSIIMPYKNCEEFLQETLDSLINQTYLNWELIAVNDHSEDESFNLVQASLQNDHRIKNINNTGQGIIEALKTGYALAQGQYITRMDADDICTNEKIQQLKDTIDTHGPNTVAIGKVYYFKADGTAIGNGYLNYQNWINQLAEQQNSFSEIYKECPIPSPSWMLLRTTFDQIGAFNANIYPEDYELAFRMYKAKLKPVGTPNQVHHWRDYTTRTSRTHHHYKDNRFLSLKVQAFIDLDLKHNSPLYLLGAGKKGKTIAKLLIASNIDFHWLCGIESKIGHNIYGKILQNSAQTIENSQLIVTIASSKDLSQIKLNEVNSNDYYYFC
ncbi:MAG: glycosyltransferase [Flavobacteriales bacterium]|jgi:glycosyltransferase involved in cell wall biosynthesis|nr:glycosyltransferase [Flavobacteriales bacterium]